jgi:hypothetical protein
MNSYKDRNRKTITLPSGATVSIRKLVAADYLVDKEIPVADFMGSKKPGQSADVVTPERLRWGVALSKRILFNCTGPFLFEGQTFKIVDKPSDKCADNELAFEDLDQADADAIAAEVNVFSGLTPQAAEAVRPFPEKQEDGNAGAPTGEALRLPSDGDTQVANA